MFGFRTHTRTQRRDRMLLEQLFTLKRFGEQIMSAVENLKGAALRLGASVDAAIAKMETGGVSEAEIQGVADQLEAMKGRLDAVVTPAPATEPAPAPTEQAASADQGGSSGIG